MAGKPGFPLDWETWVPLDWIPGGWPGENGLTGRPTPFGRPNQGVPNWPLEFSSTRKEGFFNHSRLEPRLPFLTWGIKPREGKNYGPGPLWANWGWVGPKRPGLTHWFGWIKTPLGAHLGPGGCWEELVRRGPNRFGPKFKGGTVWALGFIISLLPFKGFLAQLGSVLPLGYPF